MVGAIITGAIILDRAGTWYPVGRDKQAVIRAHGETPKG